MHTVVAETRSPREPQPACAVLPKTATPNGGKNMKLSKKILAALSAAALLAATALFASCSDDEDDDKNGTAYATLPESMGENPLKEKTWQYKATGYDETYSWSFDETTATYTDSETDYQNIYTYKYSYDANQNLLYLTLQSASTCLFSWFCSSMAAFMARRITTPVLCFTDMSWTSL